MPQLSPEARLAKLIAAQERDARRPFIRAQPGMRQFCDLESTSDDEPTAFDPPDPGADVEATLAAIEDLEQYLAGPRRLPILLFWIRLTLTVVGGNLLYWRPDVETAVSRKLPCPVCNDGPQRARACLACCRSPKIVEVELRRNATNLRFTRDSTDPIEQAKPEATKADKQAARPPSDVATLAAAATKTKGRTTAAKADLVRVVKPGSSRVRQVARSAVAGYFAAGFTVAPPTG